MKIFNQELVRKHFPECAMMPEAMRVWSLPKGKENMLQEMCNSGDYFAQIKKDGFFYQFVKGETTSYLFSRNTSVSTGLLTEKIDNVPHIKKALDTLPKETILIGEIYVEGGTSKDTTRIMGCLAEEAIKRQEEEGYVRYYIHDIIAFNGVSLMDIGAKGRYDILSKVYEKFELEKHSCLELANIYEDDIFEEIGKALDRGEEGMVLKKKDFPYSPGKKPAWSMIKCKKVDYADVVCMGFEDATKEYTGIELDSWQYWEDAKGTKYNSYSLAHESEFPIMPITKPYYFNWKTSIKIGGYDENGNLIEIGTCSSGLTDELREDFAKNPDNYLGKTVMVQCMEKDNKAHTLRHPVLKGFRIDKDAEECTIAEIFSA